MNDIEKDILNKIAELSTSLDNSGLTKEAEELDNLLEQIARPKEE